MATWSSAVFGSGASFTEFQDPNSRGRLPLPEARRISPAELQAGGVSPTYCGSTTDVWVTSPTQRYPSPCPTLEYGSLIPGSSQRIASPIREPQQYVTMVKGGTGKEMMEVERISLMPEAPIVSVKKVDMEVTQVDTDVVRMQYFEARLTEVQEMIMQHISALTAKCSGMENQLATLKDLAIQSGNQQKDNLERIGKMETDMQKPRGGETNVWEKERVLMEVDGMHKRLQEMDEAMKRMQTTVVTVVDVDRWNRGLEEKLRGVLQQNFEETSVEWRNFVSATENRLSMAEETRAWLKESCQQTQNEVLLLRKDFEGLADKEGRSELQVAEFERRMYNEITRLVKLEIVENFGTKQAIADMKNQVAAFERFIQTEISGLIRQEVNGLERLTQAEISDIVSREMRSLESLRYEFQDLKAKVEANGRLTEVEVKELLRLELDGLQVLHREVQDLKAKMEANGRLTEVEVKELLRIELDGLQVMHREFQALKGEVKQFERMTKQEVMDIIRVEFAEIWALRGLNQEVQQLKAEMGRFERLTEAQVITLAQQQINDRMRSFQGGSQPENLAELRLTVETLSDVQRMQAEQIALLSGGDPEPVPALQEELDKDVAVMRYEQDREEQAVRWHEQERVEVYTTLRNEQVEEHRRVMRTGEKEEQKSGSFLSNLNPLTWGST